MIVLDNAVLVDEPEGEIVTELEKENVFQGIICHGFIKRPGDIYLISFFENL